MSKIRVGIIGLGNILPMHVAPVAHYGDLEIVGVCDIKEDRAIRSSKMLGVPYFLDYKQLIKQAKPQAVHICTPHYMHAAITKFALQNKVHVLCEKPMSIHLSDGEENVAIAQQAGLCYGVIFQSRYNDASQLIKRCIQDGSLGSIISARVVLTWNKPDSYYALSDWKGTWDKEGGGVIIDQAIHSLDLANWFIDDEFVSVQSSLHNRNHSIMEVDDTGEGFVRYKNGATLGFWATNNYGCDEPIELRLFCQKGKAVLSYEHATITFDSGETLSVTQSMDSDINYWDAKDYWGFQHHKQIREFYDSIKSGKEPEISGREALKIQRLVCAIYQNSSGIERPKQKQD